MVCSNIRSPSQIQHVVMKSRIHHRVHKKLSVERNPNDMNSDLALMHIFLIWEHINEAYEITLLPGRCVFWGGGRLGYVRFD
jgi:hypothetical protein